MTMAHSLHVAERRHSGTPLGLMQAPRVKPPSSLKAASHQPKSDAIEALAPSLQELVEFQREFYERTIPLWNAMLKRMGTSEMDTSAPSSKRAGKEE
ncbi:MAG TPA: hypothetical protein VGA59_17770 [Ramlibacter sp.]|jgi:hypothetical protein